MSFGILTMKPPHPEGLGSESNPASWAHTVPQARGMCRPFQFAMGSAQPCLDAGRYLMLIRQHHAKGRQKLYGARVMPADVQG
jgi:hypothetical protein